MSWDKEFDDEFEAALEALKKNREIYDEETKRQLKEIRDSDWHSTRYLREILWELRYARRRADRP
jgi:hypothetical protein